VDWAAEIYRAHVPSPRNFPDCGGTGVTTYAENIGVMAATKVYSTVLFVTIGRPGQQKPRRSGQEAHHERAIGYFCGRKFLAGQNLQRMTHASILAFICSR
jgi:hypothetical protein